MVDLSLRGCRKSPDSSLRVLISDEQTKETDGNVGSLFFYRHSGGVLSQSPVRDGMSVEKQIVLPKESRQG
jgi:hypothetical protein